MDYWLIIDIILIIWVIFDLFTGRVWLYKEIKRDEETILYWTIWTIWVGVVVTIILGAL